MATNTDLKKASRSSRRLHETIAAVCDTFFPSIHLSADAGDSSVVQFYGTSASAAGVPERVTEYFQGKVRHPKIALARPALLLLSTSVGSLILCGRRCLSLTFPYFRRFSQLSHEQREDILLSWSTHWFFLLRILYTSLKLFTHLLYFTKVDDRNDNVSWRAIGYRVPDSTGAEAHQEKGNPEGGQGPLCKGIIDTRKPRERVKRGLENAGFTVVSNSPLTFKCDAVVIGSGSGGGVVAGVLAKAGHKVVVLEKGSYLARGDLTLLEGKALEEMYLENGLLATNDMEVLMLAGSTVGGGSAINWSACIKTPTHVRKEWSDRYFLNFFDTKVYDHALDVVCERMGVQEEVHDEGLLNMVLRKGCENLGYPVENIPRNAPSDHYCGWCSFGCRDGRKKATSETWLVDAVESGNGVILPKCEAIKVMISKVTGGRKRAAVTGVEFGFQNEDGGQEIGVVECRVVVAAAGAICTPPLLKRSGLKNPSIGRNLHLHPVVMAWGYFPTTSPWPESGKNSYEGGIMTAMSKIVANFEDSGYGAIIQTPSLHPGMFAALTPWVSGKDIRDKMTRFSRTAHVFALVRDVGSGTVISEYDIAYKLGGLDRDNIRKGIEQVLRILAAAGAEEIGTQHAGGRVLKVNECDEEEMERFVKEESKRPFKKLSSPICSAHQMGSCRMGVDPRWSAVDPTGETWEAEGLYVADSSVFPTALGVNPMVTVQAIAYRTSLSILDSLSRR